MQIGFLLDREHARVLFYEIPKKLLFSKKEKIMKEKIHPKYESVTFTCSCGNKIETKATVGSRHIDICSECHPFYTGKQKLIDSAGRVDRFRKRYQKFKKES